MEIEMEYKSVIVEEKNSKDIVDFMKKVDEEVNGLIRDEWMLMEAPEFVEIDGKTNCICHFMKRKLANPTTVPPEIIKAEIAALDFGKKYNDSLDPKFRDLLEINGVKIYLKDGEFHINHQDKDYEGINAETILDCLKASKHCPMDLDEEWVKQQVEILI